VWQSVNVSKKIKQIRITPENYKKLRECQELLLVRASLTTLANVAISIGLQGGHPGLTLPKK
jgi:hypothetical protein